MTSKKSLLILLLGLICSAPSQLLAGETAPNYTPTITESNGVYTINFEHSTANLQFYTCVQMVIIDGASVQATVVRFAPNITNPVGPIQSIHGSKSGGNRVFNQTINVLGQPGEYAMVVEIYTNNIDGANPGAMGTPEGKGTLVSSRSAGGGN